jgi:hypothetical protein
MERSADLLAASVPPSSEALWAPPDQKLSDLKLSILPILPG